MRIHQLIQSRLVKGIKIPIFGKRHIGRRHGLGFMSSKQVLIVSTHGLFREGLKHILAGEIDLALAKFATSIQEAEEQAQAGHVDVVIVAQEYEKDKPPLLDKTFSRLLQIPGLRVIAASLDSGDLWIYRHELVIEASVEDLVAALTD